MNVDARKLSLIWRNTADGRGEDECSDSMDRLTPSTAYMRLRETQKLLQDVYDWRKCLIGTSAREGETYACVIPICVEHLRLEGRAFQRPTACNKVAAEALARSCGYVLKRLAKERRKLYYGMGPQRKHPALAVSAL